MKFRKKPVEVEAVHVKVSKGENGYAQDVDYWRLTHFDGRVEHLSDWEFCKEYEPVEPASPDRGTGG